MLKKAETYEIMTPESVGLSRSKLVMGKHSGRHDFKSKLEELGFTLSDNEIQDAFVRFKDLADAKQDVYDEYTIRSEEHTSELQSLMRHSYAAFCSNTTS